MKFRRKAADPIDDGQGSVDDRADGQDDEQADERADERAGDEVAAAEAGPIDAEDIDDDRERVDLGALLLLPVEGKELQLQVDEASGEVQSVMLAGPDEALELRVFAAPRHGDLWSEVRPQIAAEVESRGGSTSEREGRFGTELVCQVPVTLPDGKNATQPSRIIGINGSRWLLRASLLGRPAVDPDADTELLDVLTTVAVRRGSHAMPVGDPLPLTLPSEARRQGS